MTAVFYDDGTYVVRSVHAPDTRTRVVHIVDGKVVIGKHKFSQSDFFRVNVMMRPATEVESGNTEK